MLPFNATYPGLEYTSSNPDVVDVDRYSGLVCASGIGTAIITARSFSNPAAYATCTVTVNSVLTGADKYITDQKTKEAIIRSKNLVGALHSEYLNGEIPFDIKEQLQKEAEYAADIARADYIILNPQSNFAYQYFRNRNKVNGDTTPFNRTLKYNASNPMTGLDVMIVQRALQVLGDFEPDEKYVYGTYDQETYDAAASKQGLLTGTVFDEHSYRVLFQKSTEPYFTVAALTNLAEYSRQHYTVQLALQNELQAGIEVSVKHGGPNGGTGRADVLKDLGTHSLVWEVKPNKDRYNSSGNRQFNNYITAAATYKQDFSTPLQRDFSFKPFGVHYNESYDLLVTSSDLIPGLVNYQLVKRDETKNYELVPITVPEHAYEIETQAVLNAIGVA